MRRRYSVAFMEGKKMELTLHRARIPRGIRWLAAVILGSFERWKAQSGREETRDEAFRRRAGELLDAYGDSILRLAYSYLHNQGDAEDVLQDTLMKYMGAQPALESEEHEKAWLLRVAINLSKNRIQSNRYRAHEELDDRFFAREAPDLEYVWEAVKALPQQCAEVIHLYYQEGYSCAEIAKLLGRSEGTVRSLLSRGRGRLREILKEDYDFEV